MTYGIGGTCAPGVLMGNPPSGGTPPTAITLYYDSTLFHRTSSRIGIDGTQNPNWSVTEGVADVVTGTGVYGISWNDGANTGNNVPPAPPFSTFQTSMQNIGGGCDMEINAADYAANYGGGYPPGGYMDFINYGGFADGGVGATSWSWSVVITGQAFSNGMICSVVGAGVTTQDAAFVTNGWTGVGEYIQMIPGRTGFPAAGDNLSMDVTATATNGAGSTSQTFIHNVNWV